MLTADAFEMGLRSSRPGLLFDTMELVAALSVSAGGFDHLEPFVRTLEALQRRSGEDLEWVTRICTAAYSRPVGMPRSVDGYRTLLTERVFEIVNRWSYIQDIHTVTRLQAWFYCGFGLGRASTVLQGLEYFEVLRNAIGLLSPLDQMPVSLERMAAESARQLETVAKEDDFSRLRPLFLDVARMMDSYAFRLSGTPAEIQLPKGLAQDLQQIDTLIQQCRLDFASGATL